MKPDFLCIGAMKAGTTWLYHNLSVQPGIWLPPAKELHYFNNLQSKQRNLTAILRKDRSHKIKLSNLKYFLKNHGYLNKDKLIWYYKYFMGRPNDKWYQTLFSPKKGQICGEITPIYDIINDEAIQAIKNINQEIKIIYCLRNPLNRHISHINMAIRHKNSNINRLVGNKRLMDQGDYITNYKRWLKHFDKQQILILYYDLLENDPKSFLQLLLEFLEIKKPIYNKEIIETKNIKFQYTTEKYLENHLSKLYLPMVEEQHRFYNNDYTANWLRSTHELLKSID